MGSKKTVFKFAANPEQNTHVVTCSLCESQVAATQKTTSSPKANRAKAAPLTN